MAGDEEPANAMPEVVVTAREQRIGAVVVAFGPEPHLDACLRAVRKSRGVHVTLVVVDNGCTNPDFEGVVARHEALLVQSVGNQGFAGGCNLGVSSLSGVTTIALINSDAIVDETTLMRLAESLSNDIGIATASVRLAQEPQLMNSAGNPVHYTGVSWAGGMGQPATRHATARDVASASGAGMALSLSLWEALGGFDPQYFTYLEDTELSMRCWLMGRRIVYVPDAVVLHHYEFSRNSNKHYYLERNRLLLVLTLYERRTLILLGPALLAWEVCVTAGAVVQGWFPSKARGWLWLLKNRQHVRERRRLIQQSRCVPDTALVELLEDRLAPPSVPLPRGFYVADALLAWYWRLAVRGMRRDSDS